MKNNDGWAKGFRAFPPHLLLRDISKRREVRWFIANRGEGQYEQIIMAFEKKSELEMRW